MFGLKGFKTIAATAALVVAGWAGAASAVTVNFYDATSPHDSSTFRGYITCTSCDGLITPYVPGPLTFGLSANMMDNPTSGNSTAHNTAMVNYWLNTSFTTDTRTQVSGGPLTGSITTDAQFILLVVGVQPRYALIRNTGGLQTFTWNGQASSGAGISDWDTFGVAPVPLPAGGLLLMGALGGLGLVKRRRRKAA